MCTLFLLLPQSWVNRIIIEHLWNRFISNWNRYDQTDYGNRYAASTRGDTIESKQDHFSNHYKCIDIQSRPWMNSNHNWLVTFYKRNCNRINQLITKFIIDNRSFFISQMGQTKSSRDHFLNAFWNDYSLNFLIWIQ